MLLILSMHRSGSSMLAGMLAEAGFFPGAENDLIPATVHNPKGFFELGFINRINEDLISAGPSSHLVPCLEEPICISKEQELVLLNAAKRLRDSGVNLIKDPRFCLTLPHWRNLFPGLKVVLLCRHPAEVAASMRGRHNLPSVMGCSLWDFYTRRALKYSDRIPRKVVLFDELLQGADGVLSDISSWYFERQTTESLAQSFLDESLVHNKSDVLDDDCILEYQLDLWNALSRRELDRITREDNKITSAFLSLLQEFASRGYDPVLGGMQDSESKARELEALMIAKEARGQNEALLDLLEKAFGNPLVKYATNYQNLKQGVTGKTGALVALKSLLKEQ